MELQSSNTQENQEEVCSLCEGTGIRIIPTAPDDEIEQSCVCQERCAYDQIVDDTN